ENGSCTKTEAERLLSFCNNSGPAFIFGVVGAGVFASGRIALLLYLAHTLASVCVGILFRFWGKSDNVAGRSLRAKPEKPLIPAFTDAIKNSVQSTLNICGFVIFFTVLIKLLFLSGAIPSLAAVLGRLLSPLGFDEAWGERLLTGMIELSSGVWTLRGAAGRLTGSVAMAAFMLGWAGLSVHFQVMSFIGESGLSVRTYIAGKLLQGLLSAGLILLLARAFVFELPAAAYLAEQVTGIAEFGFWRTLGLSTLGAAGALCVVLTAARRRVKKQ
ncbi:MAG: sporulation protein, partial [Oscillospiraceae bacterium]|nr:sporulation protein [Oscillospiraceae bacterium]